MDRIGIAQDSFPFGWGSGQLPVNSLAPAMGLVGMSSAEGRPHYPLEHDVETLEQNAPRVRVSQRNALASRMDYLRTHIAHQTYPGTWLGESSMCGSMRQGFPEAARTRLTDLFEPRLVLTPEAAAFAESVDVGDEIQIMLWLAQRHLPGTERAVVAAIRDPEDGTSSLHMTVRTSASVHEVVEAEDRLHDALFDRLTRASRSLISLGYEFAARRNGSTGFPESGRQSLSIGGGGRSTNLDREVVLRAVQPSATQARGPAPSAHERGGPPSGGSLPGE